MKSTFAEQTTELDFHVYMNLCVSIAFNSLREYNKHFHKCKKLETHEKICVTAFIKEKILHFNSEYI